MQAIEEANEIVGALVALRRGNVECRAVGDAGLCGALLRRNDRRFVEVEAVEA